MQKYMCTTDEKKVGAHVEEFIVLFGQGLQMESRSGEEMESH